MKTYIAKRLLGAIPTLIFISMIVFVVIQLPPGDIVTSTLDRMQSQGVELSSEAIQNLRAQYNLDQPLPLQYLSWITNFVTGDMGYSYLFNRPVNELVGERIGYTLLITLSALLFTWAVAYSCGCLFGSAPVLARRLRPHHRHAGGFGDAEFFAGANRHVLRLRVVWYQYRRAVFTGVS
jgi:ABC-type dipeptide/oligopeptide/nickel transport system permease component